MPERWVCVTSPGEIAAPIASDEPAGYRAVGRHLDADRKRSAGIAPGVVFKDWLCVYRECVRRKHSVALIQPTRHSILFG